MGRKQLSPQDLDRGFGQADAAARILQALLEVPDVAQRLHLLTGAFVEPSEEAAAAQVGYPLRQDFNVPSWGLQIYVC